MMLKYYAMLEKMHLVKSTVFLRINWNRHVVELEYLTYIYRNLVLNQRKGKI